MESNQSATRHSRGLSNASAGGFAGSAGAYANGFGPAGGSANLPLSLPSSRPAQQNTFTPSDRLASPPASQQAFPYTYNRVGGQPGTGNWL